MHPVHDMPYLYSENKLHGYVCFFLRALLLLSLFYHPFNPISTDSFDITLLVLFSILYHMFGELSIKIVISFYFITKFFIPCGNNFLVFIFTI